MGRLIMFVVALLAPIVAMAQNRFPKPDFESGYVAGGDWYVIPNGRQDYMNYYNHTKELTIEISTDKLVPSEMLEHYWDIMYNPFVGYIREVHSGIHGSVTE